MIRDALHWEKLDDKIKCRLCPHNCTISEGKRGICRVRENQKGVLKTLIYASTTAVNIDPIEKKPLYHFYPGSMCFSLGTASCNFHCLHCQNYDISMAAPEEISTKDILPEDAVRMAKQYGCRGISWTYNEPTIWYEYTLDSAKLAKKEGLYTVYVTNGYIQEEPLREISPYLDAMNTDVKGNDEFYRRVSGARLQPVLDTCILAKELGIHNELTYLVIPGYNDKAENIREFVEWVLENLGEWTVCHFSAFYPMYKMLDVPPTPLGTLIRARRIAKDSGIKYVYLGNVQHGEYSNTYCHKCGALIIERYGYEILIREMEKGICKKCGERITGRFD